MRDLYAEPVSSYEEMMNLCRLETRERVAETIRLCLPFADTPEGKILMEEQLYSILIQMLTYMQVSGRKLRKDRQREGIDAAMANGVHFGRKQKFVAENYIDVYKRLESGEISKTAARAEIGASTNTFMRMYRELKQDGLI
ncbi:MAG: hypothetical protein IJ062_13440 [Firmicutes bacterium]|nr:hypothetical protein [Bacillota bacterium]